METQTFLAFAALLAVFIGIPLALYALMRFTRQYNGRFRNAVGHAFEDLDRNISRPSLENKIEHEAKVVYADNERGGE